MKTTGSTSRAHLFAKECLPSQNNMPGSESCNVLKNCDGSSSFHGSQRDLNTGYCCCHQGTAVGQGLAPAPASLHLEHAVPGRTDKKIHWSLPWYGLSSHSSGTGDGCQLLGPADLFNKKWSNLQPLALVPFIWCKWEQWHSTTGHGQPLNHNAALPRQRQRLRLVERGCVKEKLLLSPSSETDLAPLQGRHAWVLISSGIS